MIYSIRDCGHSWMIKETDLTTKDIILNYVYDNEEVFLQGSDISEMFTEGRRLILQSRE